MRAWPRGRPGGRAREARAPQLLRLCRAEAAHCADVAAHRADTVAAHRALAARRTVAARRTQWRQAGAHRLWHEEGLGLRLGHRLEQTAQQLAVERDDGSGLRRKGLALGLGKGEC